MCLLISSRRSDCLYMFVYIDDIRIFFERFSYYYGIVYDNFFNSFNVQSITSIGYITIILPLNEDHLLLNQKALFLRSVRWWMKPSQHRQPYSVNSLCIENACPFLDPLKKKNLHFLIILWGRCTVPSFHFWRGWKEKLLQTKRSLSLTKMI